MKIVLSISLLLTTTLSASGDECIVADDFATTAGLWMDCANQTTAMRMEYVDSRMHAYSPLGNDSSAPALAAAMSYGWQMDMLEDWAIQVDLHIDPPVPTQGDVGMSIFIMLEGDPATMTMTRAWTFGGGTFYYYPTGGGLYRSATTWINSAIYSDQWTSGRLVDDTYFVWWDSDTGMIYGGDTLHATGSAFATNLNGFSSSSAAWVGVGGYLKGPIANAFNGTMWGDDLCVLYGSAVGAAVGACCMGDECVQAPQAGCDGTFLGIGVACVDCICDGAPSCPGDFFDDQIVNSTDLNLLLAAWGTDTCAYDIDGSGTVGMLDLLTLLRNWGSCSG